MELVSEGLIEPADFSLPPREQLYFRFASKSDDFDIEKASAANAEYACHLANLIVSSPAGQPFRNGFRPAARWLDEKYGIHSADLAVYYCNGVEGSMAPNQYWVPGMFSPMALMGKYFCYYNVDYLPPFELGVKNVERFVYELYSENTGTCRFHRKWVEDIIDEIILSHFDLKFDFWHDNFNLAKAIHLGNRDKSAPWESGRVVEIIHQYLLKWEADGLKNSDLEDWLARFERDPKEAALAYWQEILRGIDSAFEAGMDEPAHQEHGFLKKA
jgi:glyceraldehyde-3-phosphate dehydrogenase (ferredoxin)